MRLLILPTIDGDPNNVRYVLAGSGVADPEMEVRRVINAVADIAPCFIWSDVAERLVASGFVVPEVSIVDRPWDERRHLVFGTSFTVEILGESDHEFSGQRATATDAASGTLVLVLADNTALTASDQPYRRGYEGIEQVPLGSVRVMPEQFDDRAQYDAACIALRDAGFECVVDEPSAS
ncbi:hypothetical protein ACN8ZM_40270 (plasmid) [Burkholderia aenigmatica]|uniref:hypothetical protein n=1 Tax=Burkholderia aenigmatica TaxID=2015348 RepID=UPI003B430C24